VNQPLAIKPLTTFPKARIAYGATFRVDKSGSLVLAETAKIAWTKEKSNAEVFKMAGVQRRPMNRIR